MDTEVWGNITQLKFYVQTFRYRISKDTLHEYVNAKYPNMSLAL